MFKLIRCLSFLCFLLLIGCDQPESATPNSPVTAVSETTPTATVLPTITIVPPATTATTVPTTVPTTVATPVATFTPTPTPTATPRPTVTPTPEPAGLIARGAHITVDDWSLDGQWLAYWLATREDVENTPPYTSPGGRLYVVNPGTGETCVFPHFHAAAAGQFSLEWLPDNNLIVHDHETQQRWRVQPCQPGTFPLPHQPPPGRMPEDGLSPNGRFRVTTELQAEGDNILTFLTVLGHQDGAEITAVTWQTYDYLLEETVGVWVSTTQFLIWHSLDGPLLIDASEPGAVTNVLSNLFDQETLDLFIAISAAPGAEPDSFYLLV